MNAIRHYKDELEKLENLDQTHIENHMQVVTVCIAWFRERHINYTTSELLKMVELANAERWRD